MDSKITSLITYRANRAARINFEKRDELLGQEFRLRVNVSRAYREPYDGYRYNKVGLNLFELGAIDEAEIWFRRALALTRKNSAMDISFLLYNLANTLFQQKNPAKNPEIRSLLRESLQIQAGWPRPVEELYVRSMQILQKLDEMDGPAPHLNC